MRERLRLFDPGDTEALQALDGLCRVILHALEDDKPLAGCFYAVVEDAEQWPHAEALDLLLYEPLGGLRESTLDLANADCGRSRRDDALLDERLGEEV